MSRSRVASARLMAMSRSASAAATSASRLMRATSGRPMLVMYSFLSRTSLMVKLTTSSPILLMSSAQVERMRSPTISGSLTICSTVSCPMIPRRWPSITRRIKVQLSVEQIVKEPEMAFHHQANQGLPLFRPLGKKLLGSRQDRLFVGLHLDLRHRFHRDGDALLRVEVLLRCDVERHQLE